MGVPSPLRCGARPVAINHCSASPSGQPHQVALLAPRAEPGVREGVPEQMHKHLGFEPSLGCSSLQHLIDPISAQAPAGAEPKPFLIRRSMT